MHGKGAGYVVTNKALAELKKAAIREINIAGFGSCMKAAITAIIIRTKTILRRRLLLFRFADFNFSFNCLISLLILHLSNSLDG
jgi:hypothetical protein